ncbi:hypothetical protein M8C13_06230 [Crossiella sp. SN42]|uniref:hypothetical protein n=1 Tax=Crossiella sp. SN42 TaxID=2944808 RepID=UPI00207D1D23|nr:hypothetical protein [Crossiella sp. SN42]MCO1575357.1 hypothetical protein [Crossiella sp. SN42]
MSQTLTPEPDETGTEQPPAAPTTQAAPDAPAAATKAAAPLDVAGQLAELRSALDQLRTTQPATQPAPAESAGAAGELAVERVHTRLARAGIGEAEAAALLSRVDPARLLADGAPDEAAITELADALTRPLMRTTADPDQGAHGSAPAPTVDDWLRQQARRR